MVDRKADLRGTPAAPLRRCNQIVDTPQLADRGALAAAHRHLFGTLGDSPNLAWRVLTIPASADSILLTDGSAEFVGVRKRRNCPGVHYGAREKNLCADHRA